ncbi:MAG: dTDP-4-dehydrorhamnose 3,5-epimerase [Bacteroidota bacterium]|jgi:dTDP-4-dehydrorhamnose 3,5-epimerase
MELIATALKDCFILKPQIFSDDRGYFYESFNRQKFKNLSGIDIEFVQDNQAHSNYGTLRGLHFQKGDHAQAKLVRVIRGRVLDVAVDLRPDSPTYLQHVAVELSGENHHQLFVPRGFAHGYSVLEDDTLFVYKCDNYYCKEAEGGVFYKDASLNIDWKLPHEAIKLSAKDAILPSI